MAKVGRPKKYTIKNLVESGRWSPDWKKELFELGKQGKNKTHIMEYFNLTRESFYSLYNEDKMFHDTVNKAMIYSQNYWIKFAEDSFINGKSKELNSQLWSLIMRNQFKDDWSEKQYIDHSTNGEKIGSNDIVVKIISPEKDIEEDLDNNQE